MTPDNLRAEAERIADGMTDEELDWLAFGWRGREFIPAEIRKLNAKELVHLDVVKNLFGCIKYWKANPTPLGLAVREVLKRREADHAE